MSDRKNLGYKGFSMRMVAPFAAQTFAHQDDKKPPVRREIQWSLPRVVNGFGAATECFFTTLGTVGEKLGENTLNTILSRTNEQDFDLAVNMLNVPTGYACGDELVRCLSNLDAEEDDANLEYAIGRAFLWLYGVTTMQEPHDARGREIIAHFWKRAQERDNVEVDTDGDIVYFRVTELTAAERVLFPELEACSFIEMYLLNDGEVFAWIEL